MSTSAEIPKAGPVEPAPAAKTDDAGAASAAAPEGGSYDVVRRRLLEQAAELGRRAEQLNAERKKVFGGAELALVANERVRTEHNAVARDLVSVGGHLLFGFQVFMGLKAETQVGDVLAFYKFARPESGEGEWDLAQIPIAAGAPSAFLADDTFTKELRDTFRYMKDARLLRLARTDTRLLAVVQVGATLRDVKVFRWAIDAQARVTYVDARGDEDAVPPRQHSFAWTQTRREDQVAGPHPHINVLDTVFVETIGGDLTIKVENNTKDGRGVYREPVEDPNQTLDDADVSFAKVGNLVLLRIKPFREPSYRYLVFDSRTKKVVRIDAIGHACHELPEDHGIVFPGGYYLQSGEHKVFDDEVADMEFERLVRAPNGEDVLFVYHRRDEGAYLLLPYNLIKKEVSQVLRCHGYTLFPDGSLAVFRTMPEPTRVHPLQIWRSPFTTVEHAASQPKATGYLAKVGNADLVRGISDALSLRRLAAAERPSRATYEDLVLAIQRALDAHYWLGHAEAFDLASSLAAMKKTAELVLDEFDKVEAIERKAKEELDKAEAAQKELLTHVRADDLRAVEDYLRALTTLRHQRGALIGLRDLRGVDVHAVARLEKEIVEHFDEVSRASVAFFLKEDAFAPLLARLDVVVAAVEKTEKAADLQPFLKELDLVQQGLTLLAEVIGSLAIDDATARTRILEGVSSAFAQQNRARAIWQARKKELGGKEGRAEFAAQFRLFGQAVTGALALADTPEACDEQLSKLLLALEELEGKFGEIDELTVELAEKREEVASAIGARRQQLMDERQRRAQALGTAADRILAGVARRARTFTSAEELNAYFASDAMLQKLGEIQAQVAALGDTVRADDLASRRKSAKQDALRALRDKTELFDGEAIKLGQHRFSVHTQALELVLVPKDGRMMLHLAGTEYFEPIEDASLDLAKDLWDQSLPSESPEVYRGEFLAASMLLDAEDGKGELTIEALTEAARDPAALVTCVRAYAQDRLDEGYERGIHDADAARILEKLLALRASAGLLRYAASARAVALLYWASLEEKDRRVLHARAQSFGRLRERAQYAAAQAALATELEEPVEARARAFGLASALVPGEVTSAARYLAEELAQARVRFTASATADSLCRGLLSFLEEEGARRAFEDELEALREHPQERFGVALAYVEAFVAKKHVEHARAYVREAAVLLVTERQVEREPSAATVAVDVDGLLGAHPRIQARTMKLAIDELLARLVPYVNEHAARFRAFRKLKADIALRERARLRIEELAPRVLTSFVRNRLIDQVYLPLVGANLAKQIGAVGEKKRTDLMGMLLLVSPPGYGKTTLMEYVASKLGLVFVKVNGPAIGHDVTSLDPAEARTATARQEVEKINLAFEMRSNVMLYLDDIQHVSSELLQKFISLCDAQRKVEGVWKGRSRTYDLRGKKFCVVMAGNPYTETGARFSIPDMLANRADTYNLGDILGGQEELFASSYLENALTSNPSLAPLATREPKDVHALVRMARGEDVPLTDLAHGYSAAEVEEIVRVLRHLLAIEEVLLRVNREYILSAAQEDAFRTEPPFKLQGSYRNMNKLAEKVVSAMNEDEREQLVSDHYQGEAQTLTTGAEQNLLKLAALRGRMTETQRARWEEITQAYVRQKRSGGKGDDPVARVTGALSGVDEQLVRIRESIERASNAALAQADRPPPTTPTPTVHVTPQVPKVEVHLDASAGGGGGGGASEAVTHVMREHARAMEQIVQALAMLARGAHDAAPPNAPPMAPPRPAPRPGTYPPQQRLPGPGFGTAPPPPGVYGGPPPAPGSDPYLGGMVPHAPPPLVARLDELVALVRGLEHRLATASAHGAGPARFQVVLDASSPSNFYRGLDGPDVVFHGGVFVATYAKLPPLGAPVVLGIEMPGGVRFEVAAAVAWTQDDLGEASPAGFGARITSLPDEARAMISAFVRGREPLLRD